MNCSINTVWVFYKDALHHKCHLCMWPCQTPAVDRQTFRRPTFPWLLAGLLTGLCMDINTNGWVCVFDVCTNACACGNSSIIQAQWDGNTAHVPPYSLMTVLSASPTSNTPSNGNCITIFAKYQRTFNVSVKKNYICCLCVCPYSVALAIYYHIKNRYVLIFLLALPLNSQPFIWEVSRKKEKSSP